MALTVAEVDSIREYLHDPRHSFSKSGRPPDLSIAIIGYGGAGCSSFRGRIVNRSFPTEFDPFGEDFDKVLDVYGAKLQTTWCDVSLQYGLDEPRREDVVGYMRNIFDQAEGIVLLFSVADRHGFERLREFCTAWRKQKNFQKYKQTPFWIGATKIDLEEEWEVSQSEGQELCEKFGATFLMISNKDGSGSTNEEVTDLVGRALLGRIKRENEMMPRSSPLTAAEIATIGEYLDDPNNAKTDTGRPGVSILLVGPAGSGVSCLCSRIMYDIFPEAYDPTLEDHCKQVIEIYGRNIDVTWLDHCSDYEPSMGLGMQWIYTVQGVLLCYSGQLRRNLERLEDFYTRCVRSLGLEDLMNRELYVVATKLDIAHNGEWEVSAKEGEAFSRRIGARFVQVSSKERIAISREDVADIATRVLLKRATFRETKRVRLGEARGFVEERRLAEERRRNSLIGKLFSCFW